MSLVYVRNGVVVGEVYPLSDNSGRYGYLHYEADFGYEGMDTEEEAIAALINHED